MNETSGNSTLTTLLRQFRMVVVLAMLVGMLAPLAQPATTFAASATGASFDKEYAAPGSALVLTVTSDSDTKCLEVSGSHTATSTSPSATTSTSKTWTFNFNVPQNVGDGMHSVTASAFKKINNNSACGADAGEKAGTQTASYKIDRQGRR